jgi:hypothetical protein
MKPPLVFMIRLSGSVKLRWVLALGGLALGGLGRGRWRCRGRRRCRANHRRAVAALARDGGLRRGLQRRLGGADRGQPRGLVGHPVGQLVAAPVGAERGRVCCLGRLEPGRHLLGQRRFRLHHPAVAHRLVLGRVGLDPGAVQGDVAKLDQPGLAAQAQHLNEQPAERLQMALAKIADGAEVRRLQPGDRHDVDPLRTRHGDPARGVEPAAVRIQQQRGHHRRMVRRLAPVLRVGVEDRPKVQRLAHQIADQMRRMSGRHEVVDRRRQQPSLIHVPNPKGLAHGAP